VDIDTLLDQARPAERGIPLCLRGDLVARYEDLDRQRDEAEQQAKRNADSLASGGQARQLAEQMEALREQMRDSTVTFTLRALPRPKYRALLAAHPPRRGEDGEILPEDRENGLNNDTFWTPLIRACLAAPALTEEQLTRLLDEVLSDRQYEQLAIEALQVCRGEVDIPFSFAASRLMTAFGGESRQPSDSGSLSDASTAGPPEPSTSTTTLGG
jgi:hypothetical protein